VTPHIRRLYDAFGPQRCHGGVDVPNSYAKADYKSRVTHFTETIVTDEAAWPERSQA
jgi:hypothetical protein